MKRLIIAPHVDDDVIGCGGIMGAGDHVFYVGVDEHHVVPRAERIREARRVAEKTGCHLIGPDDYHVNHYRDRFTILVAQLEMFLTDHQYQEVLLPWPSYNQDHQAVYDASMVALRPHDTIHFVPRVLLYEEPDCFWPGIRQQFSPTLFRPIDIEHKLDLYETMTSQVRGHRSPDHLRALATVRGAAIMVKSAEAFHVVRWVE